MTYRPLRRREIRHRAAQHDLAPGDCRRRLHPPRGHGQGIDETIERLGRVTISIGVALLLVPTDTSQSLIERADYCLYVAKRQGRDRVICETDPEAEPRADPEAAPPARVV
jgi:GGDEF domain-containing protein